MGPEALEFPWGDADRIHEFCSGRRARGANRNAALPGVNRDDLGFRCAWSK